MQHADSSMRTINRVCDILNSFNEGTTDLTLAALSARIGIPKSSAHRLVEALKSQGIIMLTSGSQSYRLGYQIVRWGNLAQVSLNIRNVALPIMRRLSQKVGESSVLSVRNGNAGVWIEMIESDHPVRLALRIGKALALYAGASSKVLLGFLPDDEMDRILNEIELFPITPNTITDKQRLRQECIEARSSGYMVSFEETDEGVMGVASPVYDHRGKVVAGIGIIAPIARAPAERVPGIASYVVQAGQELSRMMGSLC